MFKLVLGHVAGISIEKQKKNYIVLSKFETLFPFLRGNSVPISLYIVYISQIFLKCYV